MEDKTMCWSATLFSDVHIISLKPKRERDSESITKQNPSNSRLIYPIPTTKSPQNNLFIIFKIKKVNATEE